MSDNTKPTCSICDGEGAVTAFGSYESADGTQPCQACNGTGEADMQAMVDRLTKLAEKWRVENTYEFDLCADRLDDVIAEREREGER